MTDVSKTPNEKTEPHTTDENQTNTSSSEPTGDKLPSDLPSDASALENPSEPSEPNVETPINRDSKDDDRPTKIANNHIDQDMTAQQPQKKSRATGFAIGFLFIALIALMVSLGASGYWLYPKWQQQAQSVVSLQSDLQSRAGEVAQLKQRLSELNQQLNAQGENNQTSMETLALNVEEVTLRLNTHNERLLSLSNTSRDDWLLAEAHYLVRLAGQRILIDRNAQSALGLMEAADAILRDLSLPDLFPVRQVLARDLAAIRIAAQVDREGIYLRLQGIAETVSLLPTYQLPEALREASLADEHSITETTEPKSETGASIWQRVVNWLDRLSDSFSQYFQIQHHAQPVAPLLPPSATEYLRQNLRFSIEQAQLAMLREEVQIYKAALAKSKLLVNTYFPDSGSAAALITELDYLSELDIVRELPSINNSQIQLQAYIEKLHKLGVSQADAESESEEVEQ